MIKISQKEFEVKIQDLVKGKISRIDLTKELQTDIRTLGYKIIQEISINNPDLYIEYIKKYPYKQKERDDLDYEALVIEMIVNGTYTIDAATKYNIGVRTIQRKVDKIEKENPYLISIYREIKKNNKNNIPTPKDLQEKIDKLVTRPVRTSEINETRKQELEEIERIFFNRCQFLTKQEAAQSMGISMNRVYKSLNELYRIRIEENYSNMDTSFRESLKFDGVVSDNKSNTIETKKEEKSKTEDIEKGEEK